jgi:hypothetical protein
LCESQCVLTLTLHCAKSMNCTTTKITERSYRRVYCCKLVYNETWTSYYCRSSSSNMANMPNLHELVDLRQFQAAISRLFLEQTCAVSAKAESRPMSPREIDISLLASIINVWHVTKDASSYYCYSVPSSSPYNSVTYCHIQSKLTELEERQV